MSNRFVAVALAITFLVSTSLVMGVGYLGLREMSSLQAQARSIAQEQWGDVQLAGEALMYSNRNSRLNMQIVMTGSRAEIDPLLAQRAENSAKITAIIQRLQTRVGSVQEQQLLDAVIADRNSYVQAYREATDLLLLKNDAQAARKSMVEVTTGIYSRYQSDWGEFLRFQTDEMNQELDRSSVKYSAARTKTVFLIVLAVLFTLDNAVFVFQKIVLEMRMRAQAESEIRRINQDLESQVLQRTAALDKTNQELVGEIAVRKQAEDDLNRKTAFLEAQLNSTIDGILVVDAASQTVVCNQRFLDLRRIPQALAGEKDSRLLLQYLTSTTRNPEQYLEKIRYLRDHPIETSRDEIECKDGTVVDRYSSPVIGKDGQYYGRIWTLRDITERRRNEDTLRQFSLAVEQSPVLIVITDPQGRISYVNRKFTECTGYALHEVLGRNPKLLKSGYTSPDSYKNLWETITRGGEWRGEFRNRKKNGELYWESAVIRPIKQADGTISHYIAVKEEITQQKMLETQLRQAQKLEAIGQLAAGIAHEINTPAQYVGDNTNFLKESWRALVPVLSSMQELRSAASHGALPAPLMEQFDRYWEAADIDYLQAEIPKAIDQSLDGIQRVTKIVRAMKEFSHPGSEEKQAVDLNKAVETTVTVARNEWKYVAEVEMSLEPGLPSVPCHAGEFNQVILNLLVNAAHAIAQVVGDGSQGKGKIFIQTRRDGDWVEIAIGDTGAGVPAAIQSRIFEPFFTTKPVGHGTGQGLALAHNTIVKRHGGKIWFETEVGKGTTFFLRLPLAVAAGASC